MYKFQAQHLVLLTRHLASLERIMNEPTANWNRLMGPGPGPDGELANETKSFLVGLKKACADADLTLSEMTIGTQLLSPARSTPETMKVIFTLITHEMQQRAYFRMPTEKVAFWNRLDLLDDKARKRFSAQTSELLTAATCYSYGLSVACIFHSMQAVEKGIRIVAERLNATMSGEENMRNIIDLIQLKAKNMDDLPKKDNPNKKSDSQFYSEIAITAANFKDAWRNYVAHGKAPYTDGQALMVLQDVCRFYNKLSEREEAADT